MSGKYDDIINLEHPTSKTHPRMALMDRAAQFSPFAALTGYEDVIDQTTLDAQQAFDPQTFDFEQDFDPSEESDV